MSTPSSVPADAPASIVPEEDKEQLAQEHSTLPLLRKSKSVKFSWIGPIPKLLCLDMANVGNYSYFLVVMTILFFAVSFSM